MAITRRGGLRLEVENYETFIRQIGSASSAMRNLGKEAEKTASEVTISAQQWGQLGIALAGIGTAGITAIGALGLFSSRLDELNALLNITRQNAAYMAQAEANLAAEGYILTEQGEEYVGTALAMGAQQEALTRAMSLSNEAVQEQVQGIRDLHLSGKVAIETVAALIRYGLDWTKATELARLAQDAATFAMQDSSQAVEGLIHGITTLQPRVLRSYGIMVNLNEAYRVYAAQNNLVATQLTQAQRQQAAFNAVLAQAPSIAGAYEAAMGTAAKQIRSLNTDIQDFSEAYGQFFTPVITEAVSGVRNLLHWLTELPDPLRATMIEVGSLGSGLLILTGALLKARSALLAFTGAATVAEGASALLGTALLGPAGLIAAIGGLITLGIHLQNVEEAHRDEAAAIAADIDSYPEYIRKLRESSLEAYALSEDLYDLIKAKQETDAAFDTEAIEELQGAAEDLKTTLDNLTDVDFDDPNMQMQVFMELLGDLLPTMDDATLKVIAAGGALKDWAEDDNWPSKQAIEFDKALQDLASTTLQLRQEEASELELQATRIQAYQGTETATEKLTRRAGEALNAFRALQTSKIDSYMDDVAGSTEAAARGMDNLVKKFGKAIAAIPIVSGSMRELTQIMTDAFDDANQEIIDAGVKRERALEDLDIKYLNKAEDAWIDYQRDIADSEADLVAYHAGTLQELLDLDYEYLRDRDDAWTEYQQDLADAERELQRDIEDANRERVQALQDLDREYAQDLEDARRDLNQDLEDMAREHAQNLQDIEEERIQDQLDLEQEYQRRLYDIQNAGQQRLLELQLEYEEKASDTRLRYLREALEAIEGGFYAPDFEQTLRELFLGLREFGPGEIPNEFRDAYEQMLEDLEQLRDDQYWEEQDLSDDIDREYDQRMADLEQWLADEQAAIDAAYEERMAAEQERYAREQEERQRDYERKLEDLRIARERERQEIERDHQQRLADLRLQHERERQEIALNYQRRLEDLQIEYERERQLIGEKLEEQNETARQKYDEALEDLARAKKREEDEIGLSYKRAEEDALSHYKEDLHQWVDHQDDMGEATKAGLHHMIDEVMIPEWDRMVREFGYRLDEMQRMAQEKGMIGNSPAPWWEKMGQSWAEGIGAGFDSAAMQANISSAMGDLQSQIAGVLPAPRVTVPGGMGGGSTSYNSTSNLTVNAQYRHQSETSLRNDLALYHSMMRAWGR